MKSNERSARRSEPEDLTTVTGHTGTSYLCPDLSAVDQHITLLYQEIERTPPTSRREVEQAVWADIDLLLDRRKWLEVTTLTSAR
ncbi:hypothetical protein QRX50_38215 [Amycolatopsis carbonis]|uniref:Uncharacterized protein n=1 Tax=Amycolatopsis carbonis TaxID=715471 RepID=A0A9Y2IDB4_9PSEU|nr:hypothetical protein [Amycolatopsis sp. 2-15]WIX77191.1 hypothetical protein QRX50_38215 [Amycolatopsis sp. 2-15]